MQRVTATILTIGDELLIGQVIDTNGAWLGQVLNSIGVWVSRRVLIGDNETDILQALDEASASSDIIIITGGLGPTKDDLTKGILNEYFGGKLVLHEPSLEIIKGIFEKSNRPMLPVNIQQAEVPDVCTVLLNSRGTAPGMQFERAGKLFFSLPGVPYEMKGLTEQYVLKAIQTKFSLGEVSHRTMTTMGLGESFVAERIADIEDHLPGNIKLAYLPGHQAVRLRLTEVLQSGDSSLIDTYFHQIKERLSEIVVTDQDISLPELIAALLIKFNKRVTTAESCTGGYLAAGLTALSGASAYIHGSVVSYDNAVKENLLKVPASVLKTEGAVSEPVVIQMAKQVRILMHADYSIAVSGILGPTGGTEDKPVGTVWIAVASEREVVTKLCHFRYDRLHNREATTLQALNLLRKLIEAENPLPEFPG
ncbi:competence/damage-inducible protein cinA [Arachidicoccus rhizosphaerae]|jgi:nicotinamide-nucleotide amidase|uniref:CinA-like protein n=1 Tax=Arachidicoccus rhizosphaerae TaxID=551991 RepID=A0A1H3YJM4_9BACT|nr:competence/damage-inducible protein A [Arachidicoccus rhizosphaerae]SEA11224.1 competence/damage-inducible protein cinA [Arachidicoccus rhizosphaerae]